MYWKLKVQSIRRDQTTNRCWVLGVWYYTADMVAERNTFNKKYVFYFRAWERRWSFVRDRRILNMLGDAELLSSDHQGVIDPKCIEGKYLFHFGLMFL